MSNNTLWCGYLEAGERSSAVLMDDKLSTGDAATVYVFNLKRGEILEYKRAIVEPKLRELNEDENELANELKNAYRKVRNGFIPRGTKTASIPEKGQPAPAGKNTPSSYDEADYNDDEDDFIDDGDEGDDEE